MSLFILTINTFFVGHLDILIWDSAVKSALQLPRAKVGVPYIELKHCIGQYIISNWQGDWNGAVENKLHSVKPVLGHG